jgi:hypothetical protein
MSNTIELSMQEKLNKCYNLACQVIEKDKTTNNNLVWAYAEGHMQKRIEDLMFGHCSLLAFQNFNQEEEENYIDQDIEDLTNTLNSIR